MVIRSLSSAARFRPLVFVIEPIATERLIYAEVLAHNLRPAPTVESFAALDEARAALAGSPPLVVLCAWRLRERTAADLFALMRASEALAAVPVILLADASVPQELAAAGRAGAAAVLAKPVRPARLLEVCQGATTAQIARFPQLPPAGPRVLGQRDGTNDDRGGE